MLFILTGIERARHRWVEITVYGNATVYYSVKPKPQQNIHTAAMSGTATNYTLTLPTSCVYRWFECAWYDEQAADSRSMDAILLCCDRRYPGRSNVIFTFRTWYEIR